MRKTSIIILSIIISINLYCQNSKTLTNPQPKPAKIEIDTITQQLDTTTITLLIYRPINTIAKFTTTRPDSTNTQIKLSVAAAFTGKNLKSIMGTHIESGKLKKGYKSISNGYVTIIDGKIEIKPITHKLKHNQHKAIKHKGYLFQQMLLVKDSTIVPCKIFGQKETYRRALAIVNKQPIIIESEQKLKIDDFSQSLIRMGIKTALCLDMGTWSHGWIRTENNNYIPIGKLTSSTKDQTNWLIFSE
ncbi:MAG: hypothetical protein WC108_04110 [Bacteroidales bacterium]